MILPRELVGPRESMQERLLVRRFSLRYLGPMQRWIAVLALPLVLFATSAMAQEIKTLETGKIWSAYTVPEKGGPTCYLVGKPASSDPASVPRSRVDAMISHRVGEKAYNVVTFNLGYAAKKDAKAELVIDGKKYALFVDNDAAWTASAATDKAVTEALLVDIADRFVAQALHRRVVPLDETIALAAANASLDHRLSASDAIIYATARVCQAQLVTANTHFRGLPGIIIP